MQRACTSTITGPAYLAAGGPVWLAVAGVMVILRH
jgi:hypothetical protein